MLSWLWAAWDRAQAEWWLLPQPHHALVYSAWLYAPHRSLARGLMSVELGCINLAFITGPAQWLQQVFLVP